MYDIDSLHALAKFSFKVIEMKAWEGNCTSDYRAFVSEPIDKIVTSVDTGCNLWEGSTVTGGSKGSAKSYREVNMLATDAHGGSIIIVMVETNKVLGTERGKLSAS